MKKYRLFYSSLISGEGIREEHFSSIAKRRYFIADKVMTPPKRVWLLAINYDDFNDNACDIYVFDQWTCIQEVVSQGFKTFHLFEHESYEEAYKEALLMKEPNPLCYTDKERSKMYKSLYWQDW